MNERRCITLKVARRVRTAVPRGTASFPHFCDQIVLTLTRHIKLQNRKKGGLDGQRKFGLGAKVRKYNLQMKHNIHVQCS